MTALAVPLLTMNMPSTDAAVSTTASIVDYSQCANGAPPSTSTACPEGWINGALQSSNSHYREDQATPQRTVVSVPSAGSGASVTHTLTYSYQTRKDSAPAHAYDSLTTWNLTQTTADRCQGLKSGVCPTGTASTKAIPADPTSVTPAGPGISPVTSAHSIPGNMTMYGGTITAVSTPTHSNPAAGTGDDYATITVSYTVPSSTKAQNVELLFGGHLASSATSGTGWGAGLGASNISGGPYHIRFTMIDGASAGSRDNQIQASAILPLFPAFTIRKSANPTTAAPGDVVTYTVTVTNNGQGSGSTSFNDVYDSRVTIVTVPTGCTNNATTHTLSCTTGTLAPSGSQSFVYTARMPASFTGSAGGGGCSAGQFPVVNTATLSGGGSSSSTVCVNAAAHFAILKSASPTTANPGDTVTYTVRVTNDGTAAGSTSFDDVYDSRVTITSVPAGCSDTTATHTLSCTTSILNAGQSQSFVYTARMPASFTGNPGGGGCTTSQFPVANTATLAGGGSSSSTVCVNAAPRFTIAKQATPTTTTPGSTVTYTVTVTNTGTAAGGTSFNDVYDAGVTILTVPNGCTNSTATHTLSCTTNTLLAGASQVFVYTARMPASFTGSSGGGGCSAGQFPVVNTATLAGGGSDSSTVCVDAAPHFVISKSASPTTVDAGGSVTYTVRVTNDGTASGSTSFNDVYDSGVTILTVPNGCTNSTATHTLTCTTGTILAGGSQSFVYTARMPASFTGDSGGGGCSTGQFPVVNTATLTGGGSDGSTVCVNAAPHFTIGKSANPTTANPGDTVTYTLTVGNDGTASGSTTVHDVYDSRVTLLSVPAGCSNDAATHTLTCTTGTILAGGSQSFVYTAQMPSSFTGTPGGSGCTTGQFPMDNTATLTTGGSASATVCVNAPVLTISKGATCTETAVPGGFYSYTITVGNTGGAPAHNVTLTDTLPVNTRVASAGGGSFSSPNGPVTWSLGDIAPGGSVSRTLVVKIDPAANGSTIINTALASATGVPNVTATFPVTVIDVINGTAKASASGRAFGVQANLLDLVPIAPQPDTNAKSPDSLLTLDSPAPAAGVLHAAALSVDNSRSVSPAGALDTAIAKTANVKLAVPGLTLSADTVVARSQSNASALTSGSSMAGSTVQNLVVNGTKYADISTPTTIDVKDPLTGALEGHVYVLQNVGTGAAQPKPQPESTDTGPAFKSGLSVNAIHVTLTVAGVNTDVVVAHAESAASFPAGLGCQPFPSVRGDAYNLDTPNLNPPLGEVQNGLVRLPSTGGTVDSAIADLSPLGVGVGQTHTDGSITLLPAPTAHAFSSATLNNLNLLSGAITATTVQSTSSTSGATSTGTTTIEHLVIGGVDICNALGLSSVCSPTENKVLLLDNDTIIVELRETIRGTDTSEMRVNAVHVFVIGKGNPFNLPVGAEIVLSSSFSGDRLP